MFGVELYVPWDAPEALVDISLEGVVPLRSIPDVIGLIGRQADAGECRVMQGRDVRTVRVLVPDPRALDQNVHDVTTVDMGDVPESSVSIPDLASLRHQWPPAAISHMGWRQQELEAKQRFRQSRPSNCVYCGIWIKCDMYRHMARFHLDLAQLWWCPVSWCTVWKGTPQDCMDHVRGAHDVPWEVKSASLEHFLPPWIVRRQVWTDSLKPQHLGISTDILLFSDIHQSLVHHNWIHKRGLPHVAFRKNYMSQLRALLPVPVAQSMDGVLSPASTALDRYIWLVLRSLWGSRPERPDVPIDRCDRCVWWRHRLGTFQSSQFRILWTSRGRWSLTAGLHCSRCLWI